MSLDDDLEQLLAMLDGVPDCADCARRPAGTTRHPSPPGRPGPLIMICPFCGSIFKLVDGTLTRPTRLELETHPNARTIRKIHDSIVEWMVG